ncbi:ComEA family DNA-binding protein [Hippea maritima]|uniref:Helix-hairpin-helix motif protein n=1 Tax=Hippea maritima (strain ATCC 700847 / DSM 10411 / MH2) TaxID=760142 RepID=F2LUY9_HIPMA|nr:helix-hairpin-helix domain-containing protein [Hippea maritima]AEA34658.1 helix-hairpin-helix motif protein [Hippea maritima DSM 10411]
MLRVLSIRILSFLFVVSLLNVSSIYAANSKTAKLDINKATVEELLKVKGIGKSKAEAIVKFVKKERIKTMDELLKVKGIGKKTLKNIEEMFEVKTESSKPSEKKE